jgi:hypothetical protein
MHVAPVKAYFRSSYRRTRSTPIVARHREQVALAHVEHFGGPWKLYERSEISL